MREILRVKMTDLSTSWEPFPERWELYGGRALTDAIIYDEVPADSDPLGPSNVLVFAPGTLLAERPHPTAAVCRSARRAR